MFKTDQIYEGFKVIEKHALKREGEFVYIFEHCRTKAKVLYYDCESEKKSCCLAFRTPVRDDRGIPHIIEHSVLQGSKKYSLQNGFHGLNAISVADEMNAFTANDYTAYHFSSRNEKDFEMLFFYYLDAVYQPNFLTDVRIFQREGWHLENLDNGKVDCSGIVYNEMKAHMLNTIAIEYCCALDMLFPDTSLAYDAGGDITCIPSTSWEDAKKFYKTYYHPSNNVITFYGRVDIVKHLKLMNDEYFSKYNFRKYKSLNAKSKVRGKRVKECVKPITKSQYIEEEKNDVWFCYAKHEQLNNLDYLLIYLFLVYVVSYNEHKIRWRMLTEEIVSEMQIILGNCSAGAYYGFILEGIEREKMNQAYQKLAQHLKECVSDGLDYRSLKMNIKLLKRWLLEEKPHNICLDSTEKLIYDMDLFDMSMEEAFAFVEDKIENDLDYLSERLNEFMLDTTEYGILFVYPDKNYKKALVREMSSILNPRWPKWTKEEKAEIARVSKVLASTVYEESQSAEELPVLTREDLNLDLNWNKSKEIELFGKKVSVYEVPNTNDMHLAFTFDISNLSKRETTLLKAMADYLFFCYTKKRTYLETYHDSIYAFKNYKASFSYTTEGKKLKRWLKLNIEFDKNDMETALELITDVFAGTTYKPTLTYGMLYWNFIDNYELISYEPHKVAIRTSKSRYSKKANFETNTSGFVAANYLLEVMLESQKKEGLRALCTKCESIFKRVFNMSRMSVVVACSNDVASDDLETAMNKQFAKVPRVLSERDSCHIPVTFKFEPSYSAAAFNTIVQYNALSVDVREYMKEFKGSPELVETYLEEWVIYNFIRKFGNAYGGYVKYEDGVFTFYSYRDPAAEETLDIFANAAGMLANIGIRDLEAHKVAVAGKMEKYGSEFEKILAIEAYKKSGKTEEDVLKEIDKVFETTEEQILECCQEILKAASERKYDYYLVGDYDVFKTSRAGLLQTITIY